MTALSFESFFAPKVTALPSTASVPQELQYWTRQATQAINYLPSFSRFSWSTPESNETAQMGTLGFNLAPASVGSTLWIKRFGSSNTGWVAIG